MTNLDFEKEGCGASFLLGIIAVSLVVLCISQIRAVDQNQRNHDELYKLIGAHFGHALSVDLKNEGRRLAFANHLAEQVLVKEDWESGKAERKLLEHGPEGIDAYLSLEGGEEIKRGIKSFTSMNPLYAFQLAMQTQALETEKTYSPSDQKPIKFSMEWINSLSLEEKKAVDFDQVDFTEFIENLKLKLAKEKEASAAAYVAKMAIESACLQCEDVMSYLETVARDINGMH